ncbi:hypothetical protein [Nannocystis pusilla]|uniref:hypothetical protein n=1 Tax=Nannocystis pusilla TaxID=889268 RepID=UPI003DA2DDFA
MTFERAELAAGAAVAVEADRLHARAQLGHDRQALLARVAAGARRGGQLEQAGDAALVEAPRLGAGVGEGEGEALAGPPAHAQLQQRLAEVVAGLHRRRGAGGVLQQVEEDDRGALGVAALELDLTCDQALGQVGGARARGGRGHLLGGLDRVLGVAEQAGRVAAGGGVGGRGRDARAGGGEQGGAQGGGERGEGRGGGCLEGHGARDRHERSGRGRAQGPRAGRRREQGRVRG